MLERNRRELDALGGGSTLRQPPRTTSTPRETSRSAAERLLDDKLGDGWRYDLLERTRDGDDVIVRLRVTDARRGISRTQFGSASASADGASDMQGKAGDVTFSFGTGSAPTDDARDTLSRERTAERAAIESALMACARLI